MLSRTLLPTSSPMSSRPAEWPGASVGHYLIGSRIGGGAQGVVYKATDSRLNRPVAIKCLFPHLCDDDCARERFLREARAASAVEHPNICVIHEIESRREGHMFIVMAYYDGQTLRQKLREGALSVEDSVEIAAQIAEGLAAAHARGVVHRDIKPGNLMVTRDGVRILDFGLARLADSAQLTLTGSVLGTPAYMSPEQTRGEAVDARSDVWSAGVVLYRCSPGERHSLAKIGTRSATRSDPRQRHLCLRPWTSRPSSNASSSGHCARIAASVSSRRMKWRSLCAGCRDRGPSATGRAPRRRG